MSVFSEFLLHHHLHQAVSVGCSVTNRIKQVKQPRGGYLNPKIFTVKSLGEGIDELNELENVVPSLVGMAVDYLSRCNFGTKPERAFVIAKKGAAIIGESNVFNELIKDITGLDDLSIINAVKLSGFDVCYRANPMQYKPVDTICPDGPTIVNIRRMVKRSLDFFEKYGPKVLDGFTFEGGYTEIVNSGDGDFLTEDTLWDFKVSRMSIKKENTLQLLMYWRLGLHSIHPEFKSIKKLGVFNPRMNTIFFINVDDIPISIIKEVEREVIGYN